MSKSQEMNCHCIELCNYLWKYDNSYVKIPAATPATGNVFDRLVFMADCREL